MGKINTAFDLIKEIDLIHELSVVLYADSFFYGLWSENEVLIKTDNHSLENLEKLMKIWNHNYDLQMVRIMSTAKPYVHLAEGDYKKKYFDDYFKGLYPTWKVKGKAKEKDVFVKEPINTLHYFEPHFMDQLKGFDFPFKTSHISTALGNYAYLIEERIVSHISNNILHISCYKNGSFKFYNQFYCEQAEDFLYYYLLVLQEFDLDPSKATICIGGEIMEESKLMTLLKAYVNKIKLVDKNLKLKRSVNHSTHLYYDLYLCKSCV